jgi:hypothetical protein
MRNFLVFAMSKYYFDRLNIYTVYGRRYIRFKIHMICKNHQKMPLLYKSASYKHDDLRRTTKDQDLNSEDLGSHPDS